VCEDLADQFRKQGRRLVTTSNKKDRLARLIDMLSTAWAHRRTYSVAQVDVYSGPAFFWAEAVCWVLSGARKPYILTLHGGNLPDFAHRRPCRVRRLLKSAAVVTTPSRYLMETMHTYRDDMTLIANPLDIGTYNFRLRKKADPRLVWLRAFHALYNPAMAPKVLAVLVKDFSDISLIMAGPDKGDGSLQGMQKVASELGVTDRIILPGKVAKSDISIWLNKGDIFLNTTSVDNTPVSVMEAMACGLCVVSTNVGGISYLLDNEKDALLVPPDDPWAMAAAIRRILTEPGLAQRISLNARKKAEQCDWSFIMPKWEKLFLQAEESMP
jgi:glycosyltransferase involved in cell wall biosynthesis